MNCTGPAVQHGEWIVAVLWPSRLLYAGLAIALTFLAGGCRVGPDYHGPPVSPVAHSYPEATSGKEVASNDTPDDGSQASASEVESNAASAESDAIDEAAPELIDWWTAFHDPILNKLILCAVEQNRDLRVAAERIIEARARRGTVASSLFPQIDADGSFTHEKRPSGGTLGGRIRDWWSGSTDLSWEIDVFGRLHRLLEAADADIGEKRELYRDTLILLIAETATTYMEARSHQEQMAIVEGNITIQKETVRLVRSRYKYKKLDMLDVKQSEGSLKGVEAEYPTTLILYRESINRLSVLIGCPPGAVDEMMSQPRPLPHAPEHVAVGIPAELLRRRPDIRSAERKVAAQTARIGAAEGELYPQFSITGTFGLGANDFSALWSSNAIAAGITPGMRWHILNFGRYRCNVWVQESLQRQYIWEYQNTVLRAAEEVDNALVGFQQGKRRGAILQESVDDYREAVRLSQIKYRAGTVDLQRVLDSQQSLLLYQNLLVLNRTEVLRSFITLYRALGGGWQVPVRQIAATTQPPAEEQPEVIPLPQPVVQP
ncbi:MAG: efflux transporter outer membrane subunit [Pirellulales bacterium]|nr:efflux transporter outer membrane subunit [Pirellulales bacterium]